jgi:tryptophanyl-tRNA synthetase|tara:strand:- start:1066 stop:1239 length:174 start_codon:yes stop_codon:yes gene_type:complete
MKLLEFEQVETSEREIKKEMAEIIIENLLALKENYRHIDEELNYDIENLIADYEEYC